MPKLIQIMIDLIWLESDRLFSQGRPSDGFWQTKNEVFSSPRTSKNLKDYCIREGVRIHIIIADFLTAPPPVSAFTTKPFFADTDKTLGKKFKITWILPNTYFQVSEHSSIIFFSFKKKKILFSCGQVDFYSRPLIPLLGSANPFPPRLRHVRN